MQQIEDNTSDVRISDNRQAGGIVPAPSRSKRLAESPEGPTAELPASSAAERAIADGKNRRLLRSTKRHRSKPLVIANETLSDKVKYRLVDRARPGSSKEEEKLTDTSEGEGEATVIELPEDSKKEESSDSAGEAPLASDSETNLIKRKKKYVRKMDKVAKWKYSLSDIDWDESSSIKELNKHRPKVTKKRDRLNKKQIETLKQKDEQYDVMSVAQIAEDAIHSLRKVDEARGASTKIKGTLSGTMKTNLAIAITAIQKMAIKGPNVIEEESYKNKYLQLKRDYEKLIAERGIQAQQRKDSLEDTSSVEPEIKSTYKMRRGNIPTNEDNRSRRTNDVRISSHTLSSDNQNIREKAPELGDKMAKATSKQDIRDRIPMNPTNIDLRRQAILRNSKSENLEAWDSHSSLQADNTARTKKRRRKRSHKASVSSEQVSYARVVENGGKSVGNIDNMADNRAMRKQSFVRAPPITGAPTILTRKTQPVAPKTAAVVINCDNESALLPKLLSKARSQISLEDLNITETRVRRAATGGFVIEISGKDMRQKADLLADKMREVLREDDVRISRPSRQGELIIYNFDQSVDVFEVQSKVALSGDLSMSEVKMGRIRQMRNGLCSVWIKCPLECAQNLSNEGKLNIGWATARVELLKRRQLQCFRCFAPGHTRQRCPSKFDRTGFCFNCGRNDHAAYNCKYDSFCPPCSERNLPSGHRAGGERCPPVAPRKQFARGDDSRRGVGEDRQVDIRDKPFCPHCAVRKLDARHVAGSEKCSTISPVKQSSQGNNEQVAAEKTCYKDLRTVDPSGENVVVTPDIPVETDLRSSGHEVNLENAEDTMDCSAEADPTSISMEERGEPEAALEPKVDNVHISSEAPLPQRSSRGRMGGSSPLSEGKGASEDPRSCSFDSEYY